MKFFFPSPFSSSFPFFLPPSFSRDSRLVVSLGNAVLKISFSLSPLPSLYGRRPPLSCCKFLLHTGYWIIWKGNGEKENFWPNGTCKRKKERKNGRKKGRKEERRGANRGEKRGETSEKLFSRLKNPWPARNSNSTLRKSWFWIQNWSTSCHDAVSFSPVTILVVFN